MNDTPTLPGTLPGLLQPGCPVVCQGDPPRKGWVIARPDGWYFDADARVVVVVGESLPLSHHISRLALDLSRPEGVDRALRWLAGRLGLDAPLAAQLLRYDRAPPGGPWTMIAGEPHPTTRWARLQLPEGIDNPIEALRLACLAAGGAE